MSIKNWSKKMLTHVKKLLKDVRHVSVKELLEVDLKDNKKSNEK